MNRSEFSWSYTRHNLFRSCPLAYFYRYHTASASEADPGRLNELKRLLSVNSWTENIFRSAFRMTAGEGKNDPAAFNKRLFSIFRKDCASLRREGWRNDPKSVNIDVVYYGEETPGYVFASARCRLDALSANFAENLLPRLHPVEYLRMKHFKQPDSFYADGIKVWSVPDMIYEENGTLNVVTLFFENPRTSQNWVLRSAINAKFAESRWNHFGRVLPVSFFLHGPSFPPVYAAGNRKELMCIIRNSVSDMLNFESAGISEENFANFAEKQDNRNCRICVFRGECILSKNSMSSAMPV